MSFWKPNSISKTEQGLRTFTAFTAVIGAMAVLLNGVEIGRSTTSFQWSDFLEPGTSEFNVFAGGVAVLIHSVFLARAYNGGYLAVSPITEQIGLWERIRNGTAQNPHE